MTLGRYVAGSSARAKARRIGLVDQRLETEERTKRAEELKPKRETIRLLGRGIPVLPTNDGTPRAVDDGKPAHADRDARLGEFGHAFAIRATMRNGVAHACKEAGLRESGKPDDSAHVATRPPSLSDALPPPATPSAD